MATTIVRNKAIRKGHCILAAEDGRLIYSGSLREGFKRLEDNESVMQLSPEDFDRIATEEIMQRFDIQ